MTMNFLNMEAVCRRPPLGIATVCGPDAGSVSIRFDTNRQQVWRRWERMMTHKRAMATRCHCFGGVFGAMLHNLPK